MEQPPSDPRDPGNFAGGPAPGPQQHQWQQAPMPYTPPPHQPQMQPPHYVPVGFYGPPPPNDGKAVTSLVFGLVSMFCMGLGFFASIPAIVLGLMARRDIARSRGALSGGGLANAGIVLGSLSMLISIGFFVVTLVPLVLSGTSFHSRGHASASTGGPAPATAAPPPGFSEPSHAVPAAPDEDETSTTVTRGSLRVLEPHQGSGSLQRQLMEAVAHAKEKGRSVLVVTTSPGSPAGHEFDASLTDPRMQRALSTVDLVQVNMVEFANELAPLRMLTEAEPYFYKIDAAARPTDAISADEWDANVPQNMAPVLESFVAGTLRKRRSPSPLGTTL